MKRMKSFQLPAASVVLFVFSFVTHIQLTLAFVNDPFSRACFSSFDWSCNYCFDASDGTDDIDQDNEVVLLKRASAHCASLVLYTTAKLGILEIFENRTLTIDEISEKLLGVSRNNETASVLQTMLLLASVGILKEENEDEDATIAFSLAQTGLLLRNRSLNDTIV
jgi:hypothetical protein